MKINFSHYQTSHLIAFAAASFVHLGLAVWSVLPSDPIVINQQVIQVSFVAPSAANKKSENNSHKQISLNFEKENTLKQKKNNENEKTSNKSEKKSVAGKQTSGRVDPNTIATKAAETDPVFDAEYLNNPAPGYPSAAKQRNIQGKVLINVVVKTDGTPAKVVISRSSGSSILDEAALEAVSQWRFIPARRSGELIQANVIVPVEFKII
jgi:TonB family protein